MAQYLKINYMRRTDKQVYAILKSSKKPLCRDELAIEADLTVRTIDRIINRLSKENLVRRVREERKTFYEPIS